MSGLIVDDLPERDELASIYANAAGPKTHFTVSVRHKGDSRPLCQREYDSAGAPVP